MSKAIFMEKVKVAAGRKNFFDLSHTVKMTGKMGELMPVFCEEVLPGERWTLSNDTFIRFMPMIAPPMQRIDVYTHFFYVNNGQIWEDWNLFMKGETAAIPQIAITAAATAAQQRFWDYFGIPPITGLGATTVNVNALPLMAYQKIYNDYYRDQNMITELTTDLVSGVQAVGIMGTIRHRAWEHDYFTSCLPTTQKGTSGVSIPLGDVILKANAWSGLGFPQFTEGVGGAAATAGNIVATGGAAIESSGAVGAELAYDPDGTLSVAATTINDLRQAFRTQEFLELMLRGGQRDNEFLRNFFGVKGLDGRLQRPIYISGTKTPVIISEVLNTTDTGLGGEQGAMAGHGVSVGKGNTGSYTCPEHGYIIGIMSVMPRSSYSQGIRKHWRKELYSDYFLPQFAHLGEQAVTKGEVFAYQATDADTFGYLPIYSEYRYIPSRIAGAFRSTLEFWTLNRKFAATPALNEEFIDCDADDDLDRIFAVQDGSDYLLIDILHRCGASRPIPIYGTPSF